MHKRCLKFVLLLIASFVAQMANAAPGFDAGQTTRELQQEESRQLNKPRPIVPLDNESNAATNSSADGNIRIPVKAIRVTGSTLYSAAELEAMLADMVGGERSLAELELAAARISAHYREHGHFLASAYLPVQEIKDGVLEIAVLEARLDRITLDNTSRVTDGRLQAHLNALTQEQNTPMDRPLLLLRDTVGVGSLHAVLKPGAHVGTSDLLVRASPSAPYSGTLQLDNHGNRYTGEYRINAAVALHSPLKIGDQLTARVIGSDRDLLHGRIAYQLPIGGNGLRVGAAVAHTQYQLAREFKSLEAHGRASSTSLFATYPFIMTQNGYLTGAFTYEDRQLKDFVDSVSQQNEKSVKSGTLGLSGNYQDSFNGAGQTSFNLGLTFGHLNMDAEQRARDAVSARSNGDFTKLSYMFNRLQRVTDKDTFAVSLTGQWAGSNLNSSDKFSLGGSYGVRAYPQGEASGDEGAILNVELRHRFMPQLQGVIFYDYGRIKINHEQYIAGDNMRSIAGAGMGINAQVFGKISLDGYLAWSTQGGTPTSEHGASERSSRLWVQAGVEF